MLILSRRCGESIRIDDNVSITVLQLKGGQIKIGIDAPREVAVHREEVFERIANNSSNNFAVKRVSEDNGDVAPAASEENAELA